MGRPRSASMVEGMHGRRSRLRSAAGIARGRPCAAPAPRGHRGGPASHGGSTTARGNTEWPISLDSHSSSSGSLSRCAVASSCSAAACLCPRINLRGHSTPAGRRSVASAGRRCSQAPGAITRDAPATQSAIDLVPGVPGLACHLAPEGALPVARDFLRAAGVVALHARRPRDAMGATNGYPPAVTPRGSSRVGRPAPTSRLRP